MRIILLILVRFSEEQVFLKLRDIQTYLVSVHGFKLEKCGKLNHTQHEYFARNRNNAVPQLHRLTFLHLRYHMQHPAHGVV